MGECLNAFDLNADGDVYKENDKIAFNESITGYYMFYLYKDSGAVPNQLICAQNDGTSTCNGDSGSALFRIKDGKPQIVGIVSFGEECAGPNAIGYPALW